MEVAKGSKHWDADLMKTLFISVYYFNLEIFTDVQMHLDLLNWCQLWFHCENYNNFTAIII